MLLPSSTRSSRLLLPFQKVVVPTIIPGQNELKRLQLRELASLNGTLRDDESLVCTNCGETGHRKFECPELENVTQSLVCRICGGIGHVAIDCTDRNNPEAVARADERDVRLEGEYDEFMNQVGAASSNATSAPAPWKVAAAAAPAPWAAAAPPGMAPPPGGMMGGYYPPVPPPGFVCR